jgi:hypothetical protein
VRIKTPRGWVELEHGEIRVRWTARLGREVEDMGASVTVDLGDAVGVV